MPQLYPAVVHLPKCVRSAFIRPLREAV
jgi:hypothetical protein